ncbi:MAG: response regulator [Nitrospirae bacterium]|nr:response regulator [Nitrospirota bacterium]
MKTAKTHKILIIDDDPNEIELTRRTLSRAGVEVKIETASCGDAALELLQNKDDLPSLIFLDLKMPGLSGIDTLRLIRADEHVKNITVIILTNSMMESDKKGAFASGANGFLQKAYDIDQFGMDIKAVLERWLIK